MDGCLVPSAHSVKLIKNPAKLPPLSKRARDQVQTQLSACVKTQATKKKKKKTRATRDNKNKGPGSSAP